MTSKRKRRSIVPYFIFILLLSATQNSFAQGDAKVTARLDASQITIGDQARLFIEATHNQMQSKLQWAEIPDTFNHLEIVEKGKIDTVKQGDIVTYKQRLLITGFDSGSFKIPALQFSVIPNQGTASMIQTDSMQLLVQTVAVDTTKGYHGIKGIMNVKTTWLDYLAYIIGAIILIGLTIFVVLYFVRNKKVPVPQAKPLGPVETITEQYTRLLRELDQKQLWQHNQVKEYYVELTDIVRDYIEQRFRTPAMELTTDELLAKARMTKDLAPHQDLLAFILRTADLAKFAKAQPLPQEHMQALENAQHFVAITKPVITETTAG
ncbi:hypothetical protein ACTHGU_13635 [Chitinophagaceae bacterium MMS25-I14]